MMINHHLPPRSSSLESSLLSLLEQQGYLVGLPVHLDGDKRRGDRAGRILLSLSPHYLSFPFQFMFLVAIPMPIPVAIKYVAWPQNAWATYYR